MNDLLQTLIEMRNGEVALDCNRKFQEMLSAVFETGKAGELTVKVKVKPSKFAMGGGVLEVETEHDCTIKKPELGIGRSLFFVTKDGTLTRNDPAQEDMFAPEEKKTNG